MKAVRLAIDIVLLPLLGMAGIVAIWAVLSATVAGGNDSPQDARVVAEVQPESPDAGGHELVQVETRTSLAA